MTNPHADTKPEQHPPEQEPFTRFDREVVTGLLAGADFPCAPSLRRLFDAYDALLAAYEDRSKAFERAAADCVRLEGENARLRTDLDAAIKNWILPALDRVREIADDLLSPAEAEDGACHGRCGEEYGNFNCPRCRDNAHADEQTAAEASLAARPRDPAYDLLLEEIALLRKENAGLRGLLHDYNPAEAEDEQHAHAEAEDGEQEELYVCENCGRLAPISAFNDDCRPGWTHGRLIRIATVSLAEHLREAREVEQHQEEKHGE